MLILLPPSEGKTDAGQGAPLDLDALTFPELAKDRGRVVDAVTKLANGSRARARTTLGISARQDAELERDAKLLTAPAAPASAVYTGVLFDALGYATLPARARQRADRWVLVQSALFGAVGLADRIPAYRLSGDVTLPRLGGVATYWRKRLEPAMTERAGCGVVLDLRSGTYAGFWTPRDAVAERAVVGRVLQRMPDGSLKVVSHHNKATKGRLVRALVSQGAEPRSPEALAELVCGLGFDVELVAGKPGRPWRLDVVVAAP